MKNCGDGGAGGSRAGCRGLRPLPGFGAAPQNLCRSTTSQALRAAKGRKKRGSFHPHRFPHPPPPLVSLPSQISAFCALAARSPCICSRLRVALRFAQQPTGLTLPFGVPKPVPQHNLASVASGQRPQETRLIPPASFSPSAPTTRFAALANIGVLRAGRAQPLYLLTPSGRFALRATAHRADASLTACRFRFCPLNRRGGRWPRPPLVSRSTFGSLCAARNSPLG